MHGLSQTSRDICCVVFALFNVVWATLFLERWKRRGAELAYKWGTLDTPSESLEEPRPQFRVGEAKNFPIILSSSFLLQALSNLFSLSLGREWSAAVPLRGVRSSTIHRGGGVCSGGWSACPYVCSVSALSSWSCSSALSCRSVSCQNLFFYASCLSKCSLQKIKISSSCICLCLVGPNNLMNWYHDTKHVKSSLTALSRNQRYSRLWVEHTPITPLQNNGPTAKQ